MDTLFESFNDHSDSDWLKLWLAKADGKADELTNCLPDFPPSDIQVSFVGNALAGTMKEAFNFYVHAKEMFRAHGGVISEEGSFLDFGCGWGRYTRFFSKDYPSASLFAVDVNHTIIEECKQRNLPGEFLNIEPLGRLPLEDAKIISGISYSVFTHLPEHVHLHWRAELARVAKPGAVLVITVQPKRFLKYIENRGREVRGPMIFGKRIGFLRHLFKNKRGSAKWHSLLADSADKVPEFAARYDAGDLVFMEGADGNQTYGDALAPVSFIEKQWAPDFEVVDVVDDQSRFAQAVVTLKRT